MDSNTTNDAVTEQQIEPAAPTASGPSLVPAPAAQAPQPAAPAPQAPNRQRLRHNLQLKLRNQQRLHQLVVQAQRKLQ